MSQNNLGKPVPECLRSEFYWSKDDGDAIQQKRSIKPLANPDVTSYQPKDNLYRKEAQLMLTNPCDAMLYIIWLDYLRPSYCIFNFQNGRRPPSRIFVTAFFCEKFKYAPISSLSGEDRTIHVQITAHF